MKKFLKAASVILIAALLFCFWSCGNSANTPSIPSTPENPETPETPQVVTFTVLFNANAEDATGTTASVSGEKDSIVTLTTNGFSRAGYTFSGWNTSSDGSGTSYADGAEVTLTQGLTLYAQWTNASGITVTVSPNSEISVSKTVSGNSSLITLTAADGFTDYTWKIDGAVVSSVTGATVSTDGKTLTLATANLKENAIYQVTLLATKDAIPYGAQIAIQK